MVSMKKLNFSSFWENLIPNEAFYKMIHLFLCPAREEDYIVEIDYFVLPSNRRKRNIHSSLERTQSTVLSKKACAQSNSVPGASTTGLILEFVFDLNLPVSGVST